MTETGKLYLVPTPIGNLKDITIRAIEVLKQCPIILAEDTRKAQVLLKTYDIKPQRLISFFKDNEHARIGLVINLLKEGNDIAYITEAGTPGVSDPGYLLVNACYEHGIEVDCLPGPTALIPALVLSGLPSDRFCFEGFLPRRKWKKRLEELRTEPRTMIFYESPFRLAKTLARLSQFLGEGRQGAVIREISKVHQEVRRGTLKDLTTYYFENPPKGECVIVVKGYDEDRAEEDKG
ncbi:MAG: 16S rRNA (cytidine(1402)-2'-O)-methyltransferase [Chlorobi bacterium]|nr:16S rRNA (cytidine(1402)-2'-O)-methyltransferase [Chlorobiota bacterium]